MKTWGISAFKGYIAVLTTLHPGDMVEYTISSHERATILFSHISREDCLVPCAESFEGGFPWQEQPNETPQTWAFLPALVTILNLAATRTIIRDCTSRKIVYSLFCASLLWYTDENALAECAPDVQRVLSYLADSIGIVLSKERNALETLQSKRSDQRSTLAVVNSLFLSHGDTEIDKSPSRCLLNFCIIPSCGRIILWLGLQRARCTSGHVYSMVFLR